MNVELCPKLITGAAAVVTFFVAVRWCVGRFLLVDKESPSILVTNNAVRSAFGRRYRTLLQGVSSGGEGGGDSSINNEADRTTSLFLLDHQCRTGYDEARRCYNFQRRTCGPPIENMDLPRGATWLQRLIQKKEFI